MPNGAYQGQDTSHYKEKTVAVICGSYEARVCASGRLLQGSITD